jgi:DAACS family dicarboxylate/amino acid:cation (Na+ or H+) symporter
VVEPLRRDTHPQNELSRAEKPGRAGVGASAAPPPAPKKSRFPLHWQIAAAMGAGLVVGPLLGKDAVALGELGKLVIQLIKAAAAPLLFLSIVNAILKTEIRTRSAARLFFWAVLNTSIALGIGLLISNLLKPGRSLSGFTANGAAAAQYAGKKIDLIGTLTGFFPPSLVAPFADNTILTIVFLGVVIGFALRRVRTEELTAGSGAFQAVEDGAATLLRVMEVALDWVTRLIPFAVFGVVARSVGEHGYAPLKGLLVYVAVGLGGLFLHVAVTYQAWIALLTPMSLRKFWREAKGPAIYAAGANSSLATLPVTLRALDKMGVPRSASTLGACIGTNFNNDGIILYEGMAVLFVAQANGIHLTLGQQLVASLACMGAAMGVAGIPEAGFISLALVLNTVGLPVEVLPLLLTVDWIIARARSVTNVLSDILLSILIARHEPSLREEPGS